ncbi:hypothetical protein M407DRAFT_186778 [Tulasnella calospora MUT 4182]|uniref:Uncharacterized protein n=1 Tax=Tulasnella calospora MUT 4182 TaxID=1051891 RepID=A0A0C3QXA0_9AGAM|nr:hypothetical protein M407DRAFT_186778 [Tulasnella calospora MUT 4182]
MSASHISSIDSTSTDFHPPSTTTYSSHFSLSRSLLSTPTFNPPASDIQARGINRRGRTDLVCAPEPVE